MNSTKAKQRSALLKERAKLSDGEVAKKSNAICERIYSYFNWEDFGKVHVYLPIVKQKEVDTWPLVKKLWTKQPELQISTSIYGESRSLQHVIISNDTKFEEDGLGIPIPVLNFTHSSAPYDLIIVPTLGFDEQLNRLGYGRGVYDTFLHSQPRAIKMGLAYEQSKLARVVYEPHDIKLDRIASEIKLYN